MKFFATWQPLRNEDAHTALVFGFMRHAPNELALDPWLSEVLGRPVTTQALGTEAFWPSYPSVVAGRTRTEPELVIDANDGRPLRVVIEAKPGFGQHDFGQIAREIVDVASADGADRVALVMLGADLGAPAEIEVWQHRLGAELNHYDVRGIEAELRYSAWALLGRAIRRCGEKAEAWRSYADDAVAQLRFNGLLGYDGGPMFDDLEGLTVVNAVEVFNRTVKSARQLLLTLHSQPRFQTAGYVPFGRAFAMHRDGSSSVVTQEEWAFETSIILSLYRKPDWADGAGLYAAVWLMPPGDDDPELQVGAFFAADTRELVWSYANAGEADDTRSPQLAKRDKTVLANVCATDRTEWVYAGRPWRPEDSDADIIWALDALEAAARAWER
jgi:hypothetical protein